jgi:transcriptional regulator with XRE-family HTH domain
VVQDIGRNLRRIRRERDLTQVQVARLIGIRQQHLSDIEKGKIPKLSLVERIAKRLCVSPDELLRDVEVSSVVAPSTNDANASA